MTFGKANIGHTGESVCTRVDPLNTTQYVWADVKLLRVVWHDFPSYEDSPAHIGVTVRQEELWLPVKNGAEQYDSVCQAVNQIQLLGGRELHIIQPGLHTNAWMNDEKLLAWW